MQKAKPGKAIIPIPTLPFSIFVGLVNAVTLSGSHASSR
jgi:hypothetical protein